MAPYPFNFESLSLPNGTGARNGEKGLNLQIFDNCRGRIPNLQASGLRALALEAFNDPNKVLATCCSGDGLTSRLVEEEGFPFVFLGGYAVSSSLGLPDTGYIGFQDMVDKIQEVYRQVSIPIVADGDTGYGSPVNVRRTVEGFAKAGAAGIMIEDQTWPKRCGHTKGKSVVSREEAFARVQAAIDARNEGMDIFINARTDSLILGYDEAILRAKKFIEIGADLVFIEALPDRAAMQRAMDDLQFPMMANIIEGGLTENVSATDLARMGFTWAVYPFTAVAAKIKGVREALVSLKESLTVGAPTQILSADEVCEAVGFHEYWTLEERYQY